MTSKLIVFCLFAYLSIYTGLAQSPYFRQITDREGLPSMTVYDVYQSKQGYVYIGTEAGICRYDGVKFINYRVPESQGKAFSNIQEDSQGNIYFINFVGQLFTIRKGQVYEISLPKTINKQKFRTYLIDPRDNLWLGAEKLYLKRKHKQKWQSLSLNQNMVKTIQLDAKGKIWVLAYHRQLYQISPTLKIVQRIQSPESLSFTLVLDKTIKAASLQGNRIYEYDLKSQDWKRIWQGIEDEIPDQMVDIKQSTEGSFWILTYEGLVQYQENTGQYHSFLPNIFISDFFEDYEGNYWFTTFGQGLFILSSLEGLHFNPGNSALTFEQINCLSEDHLGNLYIGTNGDRLFYLDSQKQSIQATYQLPIGDVECLFYDKKLQKLYVENDDVKVFDTKKEEAPDIYSLGNTPKAFSLYQDKYLISVAGDVSLIMAPDPKHRIPDFSGKLYNNMLILARRRGRAVCVDNLNKKFWIAYADGLYCYEENGSAYEIRTPDHQSIMAISLYLDAEGLLWVGTLQEGIYALKQDIVIRHLQQKDGLISDLCRVLKDKQFLYIGTDKGLQVYHLKTGQSRVFNQEDGLPSNEIRDLIVQKDKIYLATNKGLSVLNKDFSTTNHQPPLIYLTGFDIWDEAQNLREDYDLAYHENNLTIYFTGLAFRSGGKFTYKYRMRGLDRQWTYVESSSNFAKYSALPSGKYQFEVKAINEDGIESERVASFKINIAYPIWEKGWFISLITLLLSGIILGVFINRVRAIRRKTEMEKALERATLESLKLQMNPHFLFNAMTAIQRYMIRNDAPKASLYLAKFSKLMRAVLENSRSEYIPLKQEIEMLENYLTLQKLQHKDSFEYKIDVGPSLDPEEIAIPPMFAQPFIENAIEHGISPLKEEGFIQLSFTLQDEFIRLTIKDNGIGLENSREKSKKHSSLATKITQERISLYKKSLKKDIVFKITSEDQGTQVIFQLPYQNL